MCFQSWSQKTKYYWKRVTLDVPWCKPFLYDPSCPSVGGGWSVGWLYGRLVWLCLSWFSRCGSISLTNLFPRRPLLIWSMLPNCIFMSSKLVILTVERIRRVSLLFLFSRYPHFILKEKRIKRVIKRKKNALNNASNKDRTHKKVGNHARNPQDIQHQRNMDFVRRRPGAGREHAWGWKL